MSSSKFNIGLICIFYSSFTFSLQGSSSTKENLDPNLWNAMYILSKDFYKQELDKKKLRETPSQSEDTTPLDVDKKVSPPSTPLAPEQQLPVESSKKQIVLSKKRQKETVTPQNVVVPKQDRKKGLPLFISFVEKRTLRGYQLEKVSMKVQRELKRDQEAVHKILNLLFQRKTYGLVHYLISEGLCEDCSQLSDISAEQLFETCTYKANPWNKVDRRVFKHLRTHIEKHKEELLKISLPKDTDFSNHILDIMTEEEMKNLKIKNEDVNPLFQHLQNCSREEMGIPRNTKRFLLAKPKFTQYIMQKAIENKLWELAYHLERFVDLAALKISPKEAIEGSKKLYGRKVIIPILTAKAKKEDGSREIAPYVEEATKQQAWELVSEIGRYVDTKKVNMHTKGMAQGLSDHFGKKIVPILLKDQPKKSKEVLQEIIPPKKRRKSSHEHLKDRDWEAIYNLHRRVDINDVYLTPKDAVNGLNDHYGKHVVPSILKKKSEEDKKEVIQEAIKQNAWEPVSIIKEFVPSDTIEMTPEQAVQGLSNLYGEDTVLSILKKKRILVPDPSQQNEENQNKKKILNPEIKKIFDYAIRRKAWDAALKLLFLIQQKAYKTSSSDAIYPITKEEALQKLKSTDSKEQAFYQEVLKRIYRYEPTKKELKPYLSPVEETPESPELPIDDTEIKTDIEIKPDVKPDVKTEVKAEVNRKEQVREHNLPLGTLASLSGLAGATLWGAKKMKKEKSDKKKKERKTTADEPAEKSQR